MSDKYDLDNLTVFDYCKPDSRNRISLNWLERDDHIIYPLYKVTWEKGGKITLIPINLGDNSFEKKEK